MMGQRNRKWTIVLAILLVLAIITPTLVQLYTDWLWFSGIGFESVFTTKLTTQFLLGGGVFLVVFGILYGNYLLFRRLTHHRPLLVSVRTQGHVYQQDITRPMNRFVPLGAAAIALLIAFAAVSQWFDLLTYLYHVPFNATDPVLDRDIGYYIFQMPLISFVYGLISFLLFVLLAATAALYVIQGGISYHRSGQSGGAELTFSSVSRMHIGVIAALWFAITALTTSFVDIPQLLLKEHEVLTGATYTDLYAHLPTFYILIGVAILGIIVSLMFARGSSGRLLVRTIIAYAAVVVIGNGIYPLLLQNLIVAPNQLEKEAPYIERHIESTQSAWNIGQVATRTLSSDATLSQADIRENEGTISNIRLWDRGPLLSTLGQLQEIRTYYDFVSVDNGRYTIDDEYRQVAISAREMNQQKLPEPNFINKHLTFTHGMGVTLAPVNEVTEEGLPRLFVKDLPPETEKEELEITQPGIYYGELTDDYVFTNTDAKNFDYASGDENVYTEYDGGGGVPISSSLDKLLFAARFREPKIFLNTNITSGSRILYHRNITERVRKALPFLSFDSDPYLVIADGELVWMYDAYTKSANYPYARAVEDGTNYMRDAVKVTIDAYTGEISAYIVDAEDPIINTYAAIFPDLFQPLDAMPEAVREHIRYPEDLFSYQSQLYAKYHMNEPQVFYNQEDLWETPILTGTSRGESVGPIMRHLIMRLPGKEREEFILMLPYTPRGKDNMAAWMVARSDGDHYGELLTYRSSKQRLVYGPKQVVSRISQDSTISQQISLWDQSGSEVLQGNLYVIPIEESVIYVRPLYLRARDGEIPELKRVIVAYNKEVAMAPTLEDALGKVFTGLATGDADEVADEEDDGRMPTTGLSPEQRALLDQAKQHFEAAQQAQRNGNWARYGNELEALGDVLEQLR